MNNKYKGIFILVLIWAGLLVAVLYSPIGSPELYAPMRYTALTEGASAQFEIGNSQTLPVYRNDNTSSNPVIIPAAETQQKSGQYVDEGANDDYSNYDNGQYVDEPAESRSKRSSGISNGFMAGAVESGKDKSTSAQPAPGVTSLTTDLTGYDNGTTHSIGYAPGDDPTGNPIPVGDGMPFLFMLVASYFGWKRFRS